MGIGILRRLVSFLGSLRRLCGDEGWERGALGGGYGFGVTGLKWTLFVWVDDRSREGILVIPQLSSMKSLNFRFYILSISRIASGTGRQETV